VFLYNADLTNVNLSGSDLSSVYGFQTIGLWGKNATWTNAYYYTDNEPTWASGMDAAWRSSAGILALAPNAIPEPTTLLLTLLALVAAPLRVRHG
jgi:hypothetical protein